MSKQLCPESIMFSSTKDVSRTPGITILGGYEVILEERFWSKVKKGTDDECWEWQGVILPSGYGCFIRPTRAHRMAYELATGAIPEGLCILHSCDNKRCVNPLHLRVGTHADNMHDRDERKRRSPLCGEHNPNSTLTVVDILTIRKLYSEGGITQQELGNKFDVHQKTISKIVRRKCWAWLPEKENLK